MSCNQITVPFLSPEARPVLHWCAVGHLIGKDYNQSSTAMLHFWICKPISHEVSVDCTVHSLQLSAEQSCCAWCNRWTQDVDWTTQTVSPLLSQVTTSKNEPVVRHTHIHTLVCSVVYCAVVWCFVSMVASGHADTAPCCSFKWSLKCSYFEYLQLCLWSLFILLLCL